MFRCPALRARCDLGLSTTATISWSWHAAWHSLPRGTGPSRPDFG